MEPLSKTKLKLFASLSLKKQRNLQRMFVVEGIKMVNEALLSGWRMDAVLIREGFEPNIPLLNVESAYSVSVPDFAKIVQLQEPEGIAAVVHFPHTVAEEESKDNSTLTGPGIILDGIQDPGNLGTILRIADWFGLNQVICGPGTADLFNPKTLRASMGAIFRVQVAYLSDLFSWVNAQTATVWLADMQGIDYRQAAFGSGDWLLIGNEARGVNPDWQTQPRVFAVTIPGRGGAESLNAAVATGILAARLADLPGNP